MPEGVEISNYSFAFTRPLDRNDSGVYRCEVLNDIGLRKADVTLRVQGMLPLSGPLLNPSEIKTEAPVRLPTRPDPVSSGTNLPSTFTRSSPQSSTESRLGASVPNISTVGVLETLDFSR